MNPTTADWVEWILIPSSVVLLALVHRLDLLVIVVPIAVVAGYAAAARSGCHRSSQRKI